jgi:pyridoxine kinase
MPRILSIQSWVAYGHVGNAAALFPLQRLGAEVAAIHTVQLSNHTGYSGFTGEAFPAVHIASLVQGLADRGVLAALDGILSGYLGSPEAGAAVLDAVTSTRRANPAALWCCDPVIGDDGHGLYVQPGIAAWLRDVAVPQADLLTPNRFELAWLTGHPVDRLEDIRRAAGILQLRMRPTGPRLLLVTSVPLDASQLGLLAVSSGQECLLRTPRLPFQPNGAGDLIAALFLFHILAGAQLPDAVAKAGSAVHAVLRATLASNQRELALVAAQDALLTPDPLFAPELLPSLPPF